MKTKTMRDFRRMIGRQASLAVLVLTMAAVSGCRGTKSEEPPVHPVLNMDFQERFEAQEPNDFF